MRVGFHTFGCKLNQFETEALASSMRLQGCDIVRSDQEADAYVVNTCTVTTRADHKVRSLIRGLARRHPRSLLLVTGCAAQLDADVLASLGENVVVVPQADKARLLDLPGILAAEGDARAGLRPAAPSMSPPDPFALAADQHSFHSRAFLKVQDGCDCRCAYCRVPQARGPSVSMDPAQVVLRAAALEQHGYREIVITGVNISAYSAGGIRLARLIEEIIGATRCTRLRLSSLEPESLTGELAAVLAHPRVCPHFHVPVQSGADSVLERMNRRYRSDRVIEGAAALRAAKANPFIAADIIVGFPGETAADFASTRRLIDAVGFSALHVFPFSPRPGTTAAAFRPAIPERVRSQRARELGVLGRRLSEAYARSWVDLDLEVLLEARTRTAVRGRAGNYLRVEVEGVPPGVEAIGRIARVRVTAAGMTCRAFYGAFADEASGFRPPLEL